MMKIEVWMLLGFCLVVFVAWVAVLVSQEREATREWNEQQQRMTKERQAELAKDPEWAELTRWVRTFEPIVKDDPDPGDHA